MDVNFISSLGEQVIFGIPEYNFTLMRKLAPNTFYLEIALFLLILWYLKKVRNDKNSLAIHT